MKIGKELGDVSTATLGFFRQIGVEEVGVPTRLILEQRRSRPLVPPAQMAAAGPQPEPWEEDELRAVRDRARDFDLRPVLASLPLSGDVLLGRPGREADLARIQTCVRVAGRVGLRVLTYSFTALRASEGYVLRKGEGRGGADLRAFDARRVQDLPPLESVGAVSYDAMWENLTAFLRAVVPVAEDSGMTLAAHPNDPPVAAFRGVAQPLATVADLERLVAAVESPANAIYLDTGVLTEQGADVPRVIQSFGRRGRIGTVHFRNVRVEVPGERYVESFLDEGDCDMLACLKAFQEVGYTGMIEPDHTPGIPGDTLDTWVGWAFAIGQIVALRRALSP